jgi:peptidoglycan/xylan/chitin deacetylase (PgdA/CDA1 family)
MIEHVAPSSPAHERTGNPELFPAFAGAVPVLLYHRLDTRDNDYSVAPAAFDAQLARLNASGFEAVTLDRYVRFMRGEQVELPSRPILITFDDGYASSWEIADPLLDRYGWSAVMYIATGYVGRDGYLTWDQLQEMQASGRWQIDEHAGDGHVLVTVDGEGRVGPFYANALRESSGQETFAHYQERVSNDIEDGAELLAHFVPGWTSQGTFAVPYNDYGQNHSNDARIDEWLSTYLRTRFAVVLVQESDDFTTPGRSFANRIAVSSAFDADTLHARLLRGFDRLSAGASDGSASGSVRAQ